ncbi:MAG: GNAT family N-acetyltransferase [Parvularculaceae bacterium]
MTEAAGDEEVAFRMAGEADLPAIVRLLADDPLGAARERFEDPLPEEYIDAFREMNSQGGNGILIAEIGGAVAGCLQLMMLPGLSRLGQKRAQIEGVRIDSRHRGRGLGAALLRHALKIAADNGCALAQLTTDRSRDDALRFYERHGFVNSHHGLKLALQQAPDVTDS